MQRAYPSGTAYGMMSDVNWSSVAPALITGVVGIAGVAGTLLSARISARSTTERDQLTEKRRAYAQNYSLMNELDEMLRRFLRVMPKSPGNQESQQELLERIEEAVAAFHRSASEVMLIAPDEVGTYCNDLWLRYAQIANSYSQGNTTLRPEAYDELRFKLWNAMRKDIRANTKV